MHTEEFYGFIIEAYPMNNASVFPVHTEGAFVTSISRKVNLNLSFVKRQVLFTTYYYICIVNSNQL